jgi:hypothetical protein
MVNQTGASWSPLLGWLRRIDTLMGGAVFEPFA